MIDGICCPHYEERVADFNKEIITVDCENIWAIEGNAAIVFKNGEFEKALTSGGKAYKITKNNGQINKTLL